ncbi:hypothetical protein KIPB_015645, partial [Kipferlia bialata]|eukprot:g15645.t1
MLGLDEVCQSIGAVLPLLRETVYTRSPSSGDMIFATIEEYCTVSQSLLSSDTCIRTYVSFFVAFTVGLLVSIVGLVLKQQGPS